MSGNRMSRREAALYAVQAHAFSAKDIQLFLNTHPDDGEAFNEYRRQVAMEREATRKYENKYGPLTLEAAARDEEYRWIENPWPWEGVR